MIVSIVVANAYISGVTSFMKCRFTVGIVNAITRLKTDDPVRSNHFVYLSVTTTLLRFIISNVYEVRLGVCARLSVTTAGVGQTLNYVHIQGINA